MFETWLKDKRVLYAFIFFQVVVFPDKEATSSQLFKIALLILDADKSGLYPQAREASPAT
jgi:hypothetical protein